MKHNKHAARCYGDHPWRITTNHLQITDSGLNASLFALANGYIGLRGALEDGLSQEQGNNGCYLNGVYSSEPIVYGESAYGYAKNNQSIARAPNPCPLKIRLDGEVVDLHSGELKSYEQSLELDNGILSRNFLWQSPSGKTLAVASRRLVSLTDNNLVVMEYQIQAVDFSGTLAIDSSLDGTPPAAEESDDPRVGSGLDQGDLEALRVSAQAGELQVIQQIHSSGFIIASAVGHTIDSDCLISHNNQTLGHSASCLYRFDVKAGDTITLTRYAVFFSGREADLKDSDRLLNQLHQRQQKTFTDYMNAQRIALDQFWNEADIDIGGDLSLLQGMRFNLFHLFQSIGRSGTNNIAAKGLTGHGYDGHYFWDTEIYILPFFLYTQPHLARNLLQYRYSILDAARARAREMSVEKGALFPWRTIGGEECSAYYPAGTAQFHINADIAYAVKQYHLVTGDDEFMTRAGAEIVLESARLWMAIGHFNPHKNRRFCINEVTGPDEYTALVNNNFFTNAMAQMHLQYACDLFTWLERHYPKAARDLTQKIQLEPSEVSGWQRAATAMFLPSDEQHGIHLQDDSFLDKPLWNFAETPAEKYPLLLHYHPLVIYRHQVCKQADTLLALLLLSENFSRNEKRRDFDFYEPITTHDSTLSACIHSIIASEVGYKDKALAYFGEVARMDLDNNHNNTQHGVHTACMGGTWLCLVQGFAGMRVCGGQLLFNPSLPDGITHYRFNIQFQGRRLAIAVNAEGVTYSLLKGAPLSLLHTDQVIELGSVSHHSLAVQTKVSGAIQ